MTRLPRRRLHAQRLIGEPFAGVAEAVSWFAAVQSQDYAGAKWALGMRVDGATESQIDTAFDEGRVLRTHVLRPTWHFVHPNDIRWMLALSGPRILRGIAGRHRQLGIDAQTVTTSLDVITTAMAGGKHLTRAEVGNLLQQHGVAPDGQRLPHLLAVAELEGIVVSGPRHGKQHSWVLLDERVPATEPLDHHDAVAELARRYYRGHGPATAHDFAWWSGLPLADVRSGIAYAGAALTVEEIDGVPHWSAPDAEPAPRATDIAHLLPNFDEYTVGYRDRSAALDPDRPVDPALLSLGSVLANVVMIDGRLFGAWRRTMVRGAIAVEVRAFGASVPRRRERVATAVRRLSSFLERDVQLVWS